MLLRALFLFVVAPVFTVAIIAIGAGLALRLAFGAVCAEIAGCTQWHARA